MAFGYRRLGFVVALVAGLSAALLAGPAEAAAHTSHTTGPSTRLRPSR